MRIWNYIGEFFLFRWLFGKLHHKEDYESELKSNARRTFMSDSTEDNEAPDSWSSGYYHGYSSRNIYDSYDYDRLNQSIDDFHEEQDDYDMMDDF